MEYSYYRDSRHHYLTIPCPEVENYQYRMLAMNRMDSLVPCSIRNVNGKRYLYYDITARENMEEFFRGHGGAAQEIPRLLYAISDAGAILERYLLDCGRMMLGSEFVFYDYTRGEFSFLYYPEDPAEPTGPAFYEYLADHTDPQDKMLYYTLLRLISISSNKTFVLEEGFLERSLGRKRPQGEPLPGNDETEQGENMPPNTGDTVWQNASTDRTEYIAATSAAQNDAVIGGQEDSENRKDDSTVANSPARHLVIYIAVSAIFLAGAIGLAYARFRMSMDAVYDHAAMIGMIACLVVSIMTAAFGTVRGVRSSKQELRTVRDHALWEKRNALAPVDDFR